MADESDAILDHQHLVTVLDGVRLFAPFDQLGMRLEDAEYLLLVGHRFAQEHAAPCRTAHLCRQLHIMPQFLAWSSQSFTEPIDPFAAGSETHRQQEVAR